jgi:hypothetical protein
MSSERTQPPSIAPKKAPANRPASAEPTGARPAGDDGTSMGDRIRRTTSSLRGPREEAAEAAETSRPAAPAAARPEPREDRPAASTGARKVRLSVARIDPWSVMKLSFLLSVAIGIMIVVAAAVVWQTLDSLAIFTSVNETIATITDDPEFFNVLEYASFSRVISLATMIAVVDVVLLTALSTIGAFLYNIVAALVGGVTVTLSDD